MLTVKKREGESASALMYRFNKRVKQTGLVKEARRRRFTKRDKSKLKIKLSAIHRAKQQKEYEKKRKLGIA